MPINETKTELQTHSQTIMQSQLLVKYLNQNHQTAHFHCLNKDITSTYLRSDINRRIAQ